MHAHAKRMREGYEAFSAGDMDHLRSELWAPDVVWRQAGRSPLAGDYHGPDEILGFFGRMMEMTDGTFSVELHDVTASDEHAVGLHRASATRDGRTYEANEILIAHFDDQERVTELWSTSMDPYTEDEFWS